MPRKKTERPRWKLAGAAAFVDGILELDRKAPRKQRHTAHRIWERMRAEMQECSVCERTVRQYVQERKRALGLVVNEVFVPQSYDWGVEAQVDWYEAVADLAGERTKLQVFSMRSMASGAAFHCAFLHATQQAFLEAHELGFAFFCGVFGKLRYDNLKAAVKKILRGQRREETARFIAFRSHGRFDSEFCTPAEGHEKGGVEGEAGYFRRNHWVPVPQAVDLAELNRRLREDCRGDEQRCIAGREQSVGAALRIEQQHLLPLAAEGMDLARTSFPTVNSMGCIKVLTNAYSVPLKVGVEVHAEAYASTVEVWKDGRCGALHERCYGRQKQMLELEHYLDVLSRKPGALAGSRPLEQQRRAGLWPESFDVLWQALIVRYGKQDGTRQMIDLLKLGKQNGHGRLRAAIETALATGCTDTAAVQHLFNAPDLNRTPCEAIDIGSVLALLNNYDRENCLINVGTEGEKWSNVHGAKSPAVCTGSNNMGGKGEMTKAPSSLQDLRRSLYVKAKAEPAWRFWGLYVHVCKRDTLNEAYRMAKENDGAPGIDGVTFEAIAESGVESFLEQIRDELVSNTYRPMRARKQEIPKDGGKKTIAAQPRQSATKFQKSAFRRPWLACDCTFDARPTGWLSSSPTVSRPPHRLSSVHPKPDTLNHHGDKSLDRSACDPVPRRSRRS